MKNSGRVPLHQECTEVHSRPRRECSMASERGLRGGVSPWVGEAERANEK